MISQATEEEAIPWEWWWTDANSNRPLVVSSSGGIIRWACKNSLGVSEMAQVLASAGWRFMVNTGSFFDEVSGILNLSPSDWLFTIEAVIPDEYRHPGEMESESVSSSCCATVAIMDRCGLANILRRLGKDWWWVEEITKPVYARRG